MIKITVCKDCKDRESGCHSRCERYLKERAEQLELDKNDRSTKEQKYFQMDRIMDAYNKRLRKHGRA